MTTPKGPLMSEDVEEMSLKDFVAVHSLPQRAKVTEGYDDPYNADNSFSTNDLIEVRRVICPFVEMKFHHPQHRREVKVSVQTRNVTRFRLPVPRRKPVLFGTVRQVAQAWPMAVATRSDYQAPSGNWGSTLGAENAGPPFKSGDILRVVRMYRERDEEGMRTMLEFKNQTTLELVRLPLDYAGVFAEVSDVSRTFTLAELVDIANVPRKLILRRDDQQVDHESNPIVWVTGVPMDFEGEVYIEEPRYLVEVEVVPDTDADDSDSGEGGDGSVAMSRFLVPIDSQITLKACEADYIVMSYKQCRLEELINKPPTTFPRFMKIVSWDEETTILQNHMVRPGDMLVIYRIEKVTKLAVRSGDKRFFVPLTHPNKFARAGASSFYLSEFETGPMRDARFPVQMTFDENETYVNVDDDVLPRSTLLDVDGLVDEVSVVVAKVVVGGEYLTDAFRLPLRTRLQLTFMQRFNGSTLTRMSRWDNVAEAVTKNVYNDVVRAKQPNFADPDWRPKHRSTVGILDFPAPVYDDIELATAPPPPLPPRNARSRSVTEISSVRRKTSGCSSVGGKSSTLPSGSRRALPPLPSSVDDADAGARGSPLPPLPGREKFVTKRRWSIKKDRTSKHSTTGADSDDSDYETVIDDIDYEFISAFNNMSYSKHDFSELVIPQDGNVQDFSVDQMQQLLRQLNVPDKTLTEWRQQHVDGRKFAEMTNETLAKYGLAKSLVVYFRDRSRCDVTLRL